MMTTQIRWTLLLLLAFASLGTVAYAQAGPPFRTDDPETPGNHHWEINFGWIGDRNPHEGSYSVPDIDINYGLGDRIQLKYELPIAVYELRKGPDGQGENITAAQAHTLAGIGDSLLGVKYRFYEHHPRIRKIDKEEEADFSISTYPQLSLSNPTRSVPRGIVDPGPDFLLPIEMNARLGPLRLDGEVGYWFGNSKVPQSWIRGFILGHEFGRRTEAYAEIYDQQDANTIGGQHKGREATLGLGGRQALNHSRSMVLLLMGGRSFQRVTSASGEPRWIAYTGIQFLLGPKDK